MSSYIPDRGDVVWLDFTLQSGHEQAGKRPAFVISPESYNRKVGLALFCPITNQIKDYPFEVRIPENIGIHGVILSDQLKSLDWTARKAKFISKLPQQATEEVIGKLGVLIH